MSDCKKLSMPTPAQAEMALRIVGRKKRQAGDSKQTLPGVKLPTKRTESGYERDTTECRACRDARRAGRGKTAAA